MAYQLFQLPKQFNVSSNLTLLAGAKAYFYETGTTTPQNTYQDAALTTPHANPVVADAAGVFPAIYLDPTLEYRSTLRTSADVLIYTQDNINDQLLTPETVGAALYPLTEQEIDEGITPSNFAYPPQNILRYGADPTGADDCVEAFEKAAASMPRAGGDNPQGVLVVPPGNYKFLSGITIPCTMTLQADGAQFDFSDAANDVVAITITVASQGLWTDSTLGDPIGGLSIIGPGTGGTAIGIYVNRNADDGFPSKFPIRISTLSEFQTGIKQGNRNWNWYLQGGWILRCHLGVHLPSGQTNTAEQISFFGTIISECITAGIKSESNDVDLNYFGGSIDYNDTVGVDLSGETIATFHGTHFEAAAGKIHVTNVPIAGNPVANFYGCTFTCQDGHASNPVVNGDQMHVSVYGGWVRKGGATALNRVFQSTGAYNLIVENVNQIGTITNLTLTTGGSGYKRMDDMLLTREARFDQGLRCANNVAVRGTESGGTSRDILKLNSSNNVEVGNANAALILHLKQIVTNYYGIVANGLGSNMGIYIRVAAGAPPGGEAGMEQGSILLNQADKKLYINTGTNASTTWTVVGTQT